MYEKNELDWSKYIDFILLDLLCFHAAFLTAFLLRHGLMNPYADPLYRNTVLFSSLISLMEPLFFGSFNGVFKRDGYAELAMTLRHVLTVELLTMAYLVTVKDAALYSRLVLYGTGAAYLLIDYPLRLGWKAFLKKRGERLARRSLLIVTTGEGLAGAAKGIVSSNYEFFHVAGIAVTDRDMTGERVRGLPIVAGGADVLEYICREWIDEVLIDISLPERQAGELADQLAEMGVVVHRELTREEGIPGKKQFVENICGRPVLTTTINCASPGQLLLKRAVDILAGLVGSLITLLLCVAVGPLIYRRSPGPIFFRQTRIGRNGRRFKMYKFRSMYPDAEARKKNLAEQNRIKDGLMFKMEQDPRIIGSEIRPDGSYKKGIGNFLRDWSLDEFPQFFNVLKGDMSLIGTRPPTEDEWVRYKLHHRARLAIKPGITGLWQVSGRSEITNFEEVVRLDTQYISDWSFKLDIKILFKTIGVLMGRKGSM